MLPTMAIVIPYYTHPIQGVLTLVVLIAWVVAESLSGRPKRGAADRVLDAGTKGWLVLTLAATFVGVSLAGRFIPAAEMPGTPGIPAVVGAIVTLMGIGFRAWAIVTLGRFFTRDVMIREGHAVISNGPYRLMRHPAYSGTMIAMIGLGLMVRQLAGPGHRGRWIPRVLRASHPPRGESARGELGGSVPRLREDTQAVDPAGVVAVAGGGEYADE
jgi:protein-S-isoprenylcysteine O-methyltransferase Ste14